MPHTNHLFQIDIPSGILAHTRPAITLEFMAGSLQNTLDLHSLSKLSTFFESDKPPLPLPPPLITREEDALWII